MLSLKLCNCSFPTEGVFGLNPSGNSSLLSYFPLQNCAFEPPLPSGILVNLPWDGYGYFLELHVGGEVIDQGEFVIFKEARLSVNVKFPKIQ